MANENEGGRFQAEGCEWQMKMKVADFRLKECEWK